MVELALGLGIAINLLFTEVLGLMSGGLVVPGYLALHLSRRSGTASRGSSSSTDAGDSESPS
jgi:hypothetical protein